jgi:hypothetical protein
MVTIFCSGLKALIGIEQGGHGRSIGREAHHRLFALAGGDVGGG